MFGETVAVNCEGSSVNHVYGQARLTCALRRVSAQRKARSEHPEGRRGQLHASGAPTVKPSSEEDGKVSHLRTRRQPRQSKQDQAHVGDSTSSPHGGFHGAGWQRW